MNTIRLLTAFLLLAGGVSTPPAAFAGYVTGSEYVNTSRLVQYTSNGTDYKFEWDVRYSREFDGTRFTKDVEIGFIFDAALNWDRKREDAYRKSAELSIENMWNGKYFIRDQTNGTLFPLLVDVTLIGPIDQTVTVKAARGAGDEYNMINWYVDDDRLHPLYRAHEFGHMLGLFDEYMPGAVNQFPNPLLSNDGLMGWGAVGTKARMYPRYYEQYLDYMNKLNPDGRFALVPEPAGLPLVGAAMLVMFWARASRQRRRSLARD